MRYRERTDSYNTQLRLAISEDEICESIRTRLHVPRTKAEHNRLKRALTERKRVLREKIRGTAKIALITESH